MSLCCRVSCRSYGFRYRNNIDMWYAYFLQTSPDAGSCEFLDANTLFEATACASGVRSGISSSVFFTYTNVTIKCYCFYMTPILARLQSCDTPLLIVISIALCSLSLNCTDLDC